MATEEEMRQRETLATAGLFSGIMKADSLPEVFDEGDIRELPDGSVWIAHNNKWQLWSK